jgi:hypothetical protein
LQKGNGVRCNCPGKKSQAGCPEENGDSTQRGGEDIKLIAVAIIIVILAILAVALLKRRENYITLEEVIAEARIISYYEGIIEYQGTQYILGTHDLKKRKYLIEKLNLFDFENPCVVDLRFNSQVIIKKGPGSKKHIPGSKNLKSRRK